MSTPEKPRPSLADTLARIDAALAERAPGSGPTLEQINTTRVQLGLPRLEFGHRRSCQHDGPPGPTCPGCAEIDELLTIAHVNAAAITPPPPARGWLARALHRLFG